MKYLQDLYNELGTLRWIGHDDGWDRAIEAVRRRILQVALENGARVEVPQDNPVRFIHHNL